MHKKKVNSKLYLIAKSIKYSYSVKSKLSKCIFFLSFFAGLLPVFVAKSLEKLSNDLFLLNQNIILIEQAYMDLASLYVFFCTKMMFLCFQEYVIDQDKISATYCIRKKILEYKSKVDYKYIENYEQFVEKINFASEITGFQTIESLVIVSTLGCNIVIFISVLVTLYETSNCIIFIILISCIPIGCLTYKQHKGSYIQQVRLLKERAFINYYRNLCTDETNMHELRQYGLHDFFKGKWYINSKKYREAKRKIGRKYTVINMTADVFRNLVLGITLAITVWQIYKSNALGGGHFVLVYALTRQLQNTISSLVTGIADFLGTIPYMEEFFRLEELQIQERDKAKELIKSGEIAVNNLSFKYYNSDDYALKNVCLRIGEGEKIAVVGLNGSGKSTFVNLLCGMLSPSDGEIYIGGCKIGEGKYGNISAIFQDFACYDSSLRYNVTVSNDKSKTDDNTILNLFKILDFTYKNGEYSLDDEIGIFSDSKDNLSGGQWQKIALARVVYASNASIYIFDEPTSALDPTSETDLYANYINLVGNKTTLIISHRLGIGKVVDRILVFKNGSIVEDGNHEELMKQNGEYARLFNTQREWYT